MRRNLADVSYPSDILTCSSANKVLKTVEDFSFEDYESIAEGIIELYEDIPNVVSDNSNPRADFVGCLIRLAGHALMDFRY